jgi:hypothetical protein
MIGPRPVPSFAGPTLTPTNGTAAHHPGIRYGERLLLGKAKCQDNIPEHVRLQVCRPEDGSAEIVDAVLMALLSELVVQVLNKDFPLVQKLSEHHVDSFHASPSLFSVRLDWSRHRAGAPLALLSIKITQEDLVAAEEEQVNSSRADEGQPR